MTEKFPDSGFLRGFCSGILLITGMYGMLKVIDMLILYALDRPLFIRQDSLQLMILATLALLFREQFKKGSFQSGSGLFLATFLSAMGYLMFRKYNFAE